MIAPLRVTVVDDNPAYLELMGELLSDRRFQLTLVDALDRDPMMAIHASHPDLLIIDVQIGAEPRGGWSIARAASQAPGFGHMSVLLCSAAVDMDPLQAEFATLSNFGTLPKPFALDDLDASIERLARQARSAMVQRGAHATYARIATP